MSLTRSLPYYFTDTSDNSLDNIVYLVIFSSTVCTLTIIYHFYLLRYPTTGTGTNESYNYSNEYDSTQGLFVACANTPFNHRFKHFLLHQVGDFKSPWWYSPHLGTIIPFGHDHSLQFEREILHHDNGACFAVDWFPRKPSLSEDKGDIKVCIFLPCLGGHSDHKFAQNFALTINQTHGYFTVIVTTRGIGLPLKTKEAWHPAFSDDAFLTLQHVHKLYHTRAKIFFSGFSAGTNIVIQTLLRNQRAGAAQVPVVGACCVCLIDDYATTRDELETTAVGRIYTFLLAAKQKDIIRRNMHAFRDHPKELEKLLQCTTLREFDQAALSLIYGFTSEKEWNEALSCRALVDVAIPYLGIQPRDDPLHMGKVRENMPLDLLTENKGFIYVEPAAGNHFGFYEGELWEAFSNKTSYTWPAKCAVAFFEALLESE